MKRFLGLLLMVFLVSQRSFGQAWPPETTVSKTVMVISRLAGKAYIKREGKIFTVLSFDSSERAEKTLRPIRLAVADGDLFWMEKNSTARASSVSSKGDLTEPQTIGKSYYEEDTEYRKNYNTLTPEQYRRIRLLLCSAANSKPLTDLSRAGVVLPFENAHVRASAIPYKFWVAEGVTPVQVTLSYELNNGQIDLGKWNVRGKLQGIITLDRKAIVEKLREHFGRDEGWDQKAIPVTMRLTGSRAQNYALTILLADDPSSRQAEPKLALLAKTLKESARDERDIKISGLLASTEEFSSEVLFLMAQTNDPLIRSMVGLLAEEAGIEPLALLPQGKSNIR